MDKKILIDSIDKGYSIGKIAKEIGRSRSTVVYWLNLYKLKTNNVSVTNRPENIVYTESLLKNASIDALCMADILRNLGLSVIGSSYSTIKKWLKYYNIDLSHFNKDKMSDRTNKSIQNSRQNSSLANILVENSTYLNGTCIKNKLYSNNLKTRMCEICGQGEIWNNKKMSLILDHINGKHNDNRLENLRVVCPNCNATFDTHCGKNKKRNI